MSKDKAKDIERASALILNAMKLMEQAAISIGEAGDLCNEHYLIARVPLHDSDDKLVEAAEKSADAMRDLREHIEGMVSNES